MVHAPVAVPTNPSPRGAADRDGTRRALALAVLCTSLLIVSLDNTILNVALPTLVRDLRATSSQLQWIVDSYALVFAGLLLIGGTLGDRFGRKPVYVTGLLVFAAGSAASAFSGSVNALIAARAVMGVGGALIMPSTLSIITAIFRDPADRVRAIGVWAGTTGLGVALGPLIGGVLLTHFWWGSVFLVNVPIAAAAAGMAIVLVPNSRDPHPKPPDPVGALLSVLGLGLLLWAIIEAPGRGWSSPPIVAGGSAGLLVLTGFVVWERHRSFPMLPLRFYRERRFSVATASMGMVMFGLFGGLFVLTQFLQFVLGLSPVAAGLRIMPTAAVLGMAAPLASVVVRRYGTKLPVTIGLLVIGVGLWRVSAVPAAAPTYGDVLPGMLLIGLGAGLTIPSAVDSVMGSVPLAQAGVGSATNGVSMQTGGALGVAILGSLLATRYQSHVGQALAGHAVPPAVQHIILGSLGGALAVAGRVGGATGTALAAVARSAFVSGANLAMGVGAVVALASALLALALLPSRARRQP